MAHEIMLDVQFVAPDTGEPWFRGRIFPTAETDERLQESAAVMRKLRQSTVSLPVSPLESELESIQASTDDVETLLLTLMAIDEEGRAQFGFNLLMKDGVTLISDSAWFLHPRESRVAWEALTGAPRDDDPVAMPARPETLRLNLRHELDGGDTPTHRLEVDVNDFLWRRLLGTIRTMFDLTQTETHLELLDSETTLEPLEDAADAAAAGGHRSAADEYRQRLLWIRLADAETFEVAVKAFSEFSADRDLVSGPVL